MIRIGAIKILISNCTTGIYLRWWFNGWHHFLFTNGYEIVMNTESMGTQVTKLFSLISKIERPTRIKSGYSYRVTLEGITPGNIGAFTGLLLAEKVEQYESGVWREVEITRGEHLIKNEWEDSYVLSFEITRDELPASSSVYQKSLRLYMDNELLDMDDDEVVPINKQTNDIAEMQDRQSDFTTQFRVRKTRAMKDLFELSGEAGINTTFPYEEKRCKLISDNIEVITDGQIILDKVDDQYYYVSILSGNLNFFKAIDNKKLTDLILVSADHTWNNATAVNTHIVDLDYVYPLCEPSEDSSIVPLTDDGDRVEMYTGWIWPFIKVKAIWDEIILNAGYTCEGDILTNEIFTRLFMPIINRNITKEHAAKYLYSLFWGGAQAVLLNYQLGNGHFPGVEVITGDANFKLGYYYLPFDATYKIAVSVIVAGFGVVPTLSVYRNGGFQGDMNVVSHEIAQTNYEFEVAGTAGQHIEVLTNAAYYYYFTLRITDIADAKIAYASPVIAHLHLPVLTQTEFVKIICNMFGLIPEAIPRDHKIKFWNYLDLYDNIAIARDWSAYLSERDDEIEFKFGDYAQNNYLRYKDSEDVIKDEGRGIMEIDDTTLPDEKDVIELPVSTCDRVKILTNIFSVEVSRIGFNKWNDTDADYDLNSTIDPRIVYVDHTDSIASPAYEKIFGLRPTVAPGGATDIDSPKKASSIEVSFSYLVTNNAALSRMLTKTNLRRAKFNLPVYEVAGLKHYIPIYLSQYKAYFYVNKINNYVPGQLCTIDLIKL
jgi:hypothetical protein